ncbi:hypothetical protein E4U21_004485 [Claviceps maximensis]|nr:hypothetical protein E4U21_004485 [Claviceps maximensis]
MASRAPRRELRTGAAFRSSLQDIFDEAKEKHFDTHAHFHDITASILEFLAARRTMTGAQARASCPIRLPDGQAACTHMALPPQNLKLSRETLQRLRGVDTDREFIGIILAAQFEQMAKKQQPQQQPNSPAGSGGKAERRKKRRARDALLSSPEQQSPVTRARKRKNAALTPQRVPHPQQANTDRAASVPGTSASSIRPKTKKKMAKGGYEGAFPAALRAAQAESQQLQTAVFGGSVHKPAPGQAGQVGLSKEEASSVTIISDGEPEITLKSGRKVHLTGKTSRHGTPSKTTGSSSTSPYHLALPQTPKKRHGERSDSDDSASDSEVEIVSTTNATSPMDMDDEDDDEADEFQSLTSAQKLVKDLARVLQSLSRTSKKDGRWADKSAMVEWLTLNHERVSKQSAMDPDADADGPSGRVSRLENIIRHMPDKLDALNPAKRSTYMAELRRLCHSVMLPSMDYEQRLLKVVGIVYLGEEIDAVAGREWTRLEKVLGLCSIIAEVIGSKDEVVDEERKNRWILARKMDIASLETLMVAKERCEGLGL